MFYTELVKQAADIAGISDVYNSSMNATDAQKSFDVLQTSMLALNSDDRLTFAVDDINVTLNHKTLVLTPDPDYELRDGEQAYLTNYPVEVAPAYLINNARVKLQQVSYDKFLTTYLNSQHVYALRIDYRKAMLHFNYGGELKIGLKKPLDMPENITDEVRLTGSALNLLKYKLATELLASYGMDSSPVIEQKYAEMIMRHCKIKSDILPPPILTSGDYNYGIIWT